MTVSKNKNKKKKKDKAIKLWTKIIFLVVENGDSSLGT